jgi:acyl-CoA synthetase (AMP-forming)/AMP-acid ligase II
MATNAGQTRSILSAFRRLVDTAPGRRVFTFVDEDGRDQETLTAAQLAAAAQGVAQTLRARGIEAGERVVLVYPPSLDFIKAFLGCLILGVIPVPVYPPDPFRLHKDLAAFASIVADCGARAALTTTAYERARTMGSVTGLFGRAAAQWPRIAWHRTDRRPPSGAAPVTWHQPAGPDEPAFIQYTSGSTSAPKGVVITHGNLRDEVDANAWDLDCDAYTRAVCWVPQYHDLGLISFISGTLAGNGSTHLMSPLTFLQRPDVWFDVMSRVRATHTAAPNFAFELAVRRTTPGQRSRWDLSSLRVVMSAAEPIRPATVDGFFAAFAPTGLRRSAFYPAYGLAEHTVSVSMGGQAVLRVDKQALEAGHVTPLAEGDERPAATYLGCGRITKPDARVRIVDPETCRPVGPGRVGEIWVHSSTKAQGYFGMPEETGRVFHATVAGEDDPTEYLRTGDLGFFHGEELFVTGRHKDLIIVRGRNVYPQEIEDSIRDCHPLVRPGGVAAFAIPGSNGEPAGEQLVVFVELRDKQADDARAENVARAVRDRIYAEHQLACHTVVLGRPGLVKKTTSGKVRRSACAQTLLSGAVHAAPTTMHISVQARRPEFAEVAP